MVKIEEIKEEIIIPENVEITLEKNNVLVKGEKGSLFKMLSHPNVEVVKKENKIIVSCSDSPKRKEKALVGTFTAHIKVPSLGLQYVAIHSSPSTNLVHFLAIHTHSPPYLTAKLEIDKKSKRIIVGKRNLLNLNGFFGCLTFCSHT